MIVCIGDSITAGQHLDDPAKAWPRLIPYETRQEGVPGDTTRLGLERFPKAVQASGASVAVIQFGHNDANRWATDNGLPRVSSTAYMANLVEMLARCRAFGIRPVLCTITESRKSDQHASDCARYDLLLKRVADEYGVPLADPRSVVTRPEHLLPDGLHLTESGHEVYAEAVMRVLSKQWPR